MNILEKLSDQHYLFSTNEEFKYWYVYLPFFGLFVFLAFLVSMLLKKQDSYKAKKAFERQFFWIYLIFGLLGLTSVFARLQNLPIFGSRVMTLSILVLFLIANVWLVYYYRTKTKNELLKFENKQRKEKWLKK